ncbi:MAG: hypothetical protein J6Q78_05630 [Clostridia bacterium]|nr:hypothetical protein [Clostridia bacterium]
MEYCEKNLTILLIAKYGEGHLKIPQFLRVAQETFTFHKAISIPTWLFSQKTIDTVMAVATDSHRDFLIPERTVTQYARQRISLIFRCFAFILL